MSRREISRERTSTGVGTWIEEVRVEVVAVTGPSGTETMWVAYDGVHRHGAETRDDAVYASHGRRARNARDRQPCACEVCQRAEAARVIADAAAQAD